MLSELSFSTEPTFEEKRVSVRAAVDLRDRLL